MVRSIFSALVLAAMTASATPAFAQAVRVPGTKVSLAPPAGFLAARQYPGFEQESGPASIMVTELPGPAGDMLRAMTGEALATRGLILVTAHDRTISGHPARLLHIRQQTVNGDALKWMLITGDGATTIMIVGTYPAAGSAATGSAIQQSLLTTAWGTSTPVNAFEGLPFHVTPTARLKLAHRVSNMLTFTESGTMGSPGSTEALYLVGHSIGYGDLGDLRTFSETRARQTTLTTGVGNFAGRIVQVDGRDAYELEADAVDSRSGLPLRLYQVIIPDETGYFIAQGLSGADRARVMVPEFRAVTASFRRDTPR